MSNSTKDYLFENQKFLEAVPVLSSAESVGEAVDSRSVVRFLRRYLAGLRHGPLCVFRMLSDLENTRSLFRLRARGKGRSCLVVANGPSAGFLGRQDLKTFISRGGDIFAVNHFTQIQAFMKVSPTHYFSSDPNTPFEEEFGETAKALRDAPSPIEVLVPTADRPLWKEQFPSNDVTGFCDRERLVTLFGGSRVLSPFRPRPFKSMTAHKALAFAVWAGYSRIYVIGFDNTYVRDLYVAPDRMLLLRDRHAGSEEQMSDISHLHPDSGAYLEDAAAIVSDTRLFAHANILNLDPFSIISVLPKIESVTGISQVLSEESTQNASFPAVPSTG